MGPVQERRNGQRHQAYVAVEVSIDEATSGIGVIKDISSEGLLLLTQVRLGLGQRVMLKIYRPNDEDHPLVLIGTAVRRESLSSDEIGTWREKVAFVFQKSQSELAHELSVLAARQARSMGRSGE